MTALVTSVRAKSFEGLIFFVYDREAVTKESDPPENAIVYFYPPSASIEDRISICGQLIGMSHFIHGFIGSRPALCKLQTEKIATQKSGRYTLALGGSLGEPDSLLIRQLKTLHSLFTFYHGSLDRIRMMCENQRQFLVWMNVIWDCYLHFVRHYGDFLPGVFDPLPFLDLPKTFAATCYTKASYILQACQRRKHILGGCILYSDRILCTQLEPSITERLLLLKPNQKNLPARPVQTGQDLPFGVRILNSFLTLSEYLNLYETLTESAYRQPGSPESPRAFPDLYSAASLSSTDRHFPREGPSSDNLQEISTDHDISRKVTCQKISKPRGSNSGLNLTETNGVASAVPGSCVVHSDKEYVNSGTVNQREAELKYGANGSSEREYKDKDEERFDEARRETINNQRSSDESSLLPVMRTTTKKNRNTCVSPSKNSVDMEKHQHNTSAVSSGKRPGYDVGLAEKTTLKEQRASEASAVLAEKCVEEKNEIVERIVGKTENNTVDKSNAAVLSSTALTDNSCESNGSGSVSKEGLSSFGLKVPENFKTAFDGSSIDSNLSNDVGLIMEPIDLSELKVVACSQSRVAPRSESDGETKSDPVIPCPKSDGANCRIGKVPENVVTAVCRLVLDELITQVCEIVQNEDYSTSGAICQACLELGKPRGISCSQASKSQEFSCQNTKLCESQKKGDETENNETCSKTNSVYFEQGLEIGSASCSPSIEDTKLPAPVIIDVESTTWDEQTEEMAFVENVDTTSVSASTEHSLRGRASANSRSSAAGEPVTPSPVSSNCDCEIHIANGQEEVSSDGGIGGPVDAALEETEEITLTRAESYEQTTASDHDLEEIQDILFEEEVDDINQVEGLTHVNLYVQAHSKVVLILLAEEGLSTDCNSIKALWETSLNQLGELEFLVKQTSGDQATTMHSDEYSFLVYDSFERTMKGNLDELVHQVDHLFCETTKVLHEQFENCSTLKDVMLRNLSSTVYGKRNLGRGTYFHLKGPYKTMPGVPSHRDSFLKLEKRATKVLNKDHGVNVF